MLSVLRLAAGRKRGDVPEGRGAIASARTIIVANVCQDCVAELGGAVGLRAAGGVKAEGVVMRETGNERVALGIRVNLCEVDDVAERGLERVGVHLATTDDEYMLNIVGIRWLSKKAECILKGGPQHNGFGEGGGTDGG
jgi:hypothetical protein